MGDQKLFAVYIGGMVEGCHVELHDMRFVIGATIEDCYDDLKAQWWGIPERLHLDAWGPVEWVDGFDVSLVDDAVTDSDNRLWFLNLGGYDPNLFTELHHNTFVVASDERIAKKKALAQIDGWFSPHRDAQFEIENVVDVAATIGDGRAIKLTPGEIEKPFTFEALYVPIGRMK